MKEKFVKFRFIFYRFCLKIVELVVNVKFKFFRKFELNVNVFIFEY